MWSVAEQTLHDYLATLTSKSKTHSDFLNQARWVSDLAINNHKRAQFMCNWNHSSQPNRVAIHCASLNWTPSKARKATTNNCLRSTHCKRMSKPQFWTKATKTQWLCQRVQLSNDHTFANIQWIRPRRSWLRCLDILALIRCQWTTWPTLI